MKPCEPDIPGARIDYNGQIVKEDQTNSQENLSKPTKTACFADQLADRSKTENNRIDHIKSLRIDIIPNKKEEKGIEKVEGASISSTNENPRKRVSSPPLDTEQKVKRSRQFPESSNGSQCQSLKYYGTTQERKKKEEMKLSGTSKLGAKSISSTNERPEKIISSQSRNRDKKVKRSCHLSARSIGSQGLSMSYHGTRQERKKQEEMNNRCISKLGARSISSTNERSEKRMSSQSSDRDKKVKRSCHSSASSIGSQGLSMSYHGTRQERKKQEEMEMSIWENLRSKSRSTSRSPQRFGDSGYAQNHVKKKKLS